MARLIGVELQDKWRVDYALTKIKGMGWSLSKRVLRDIKIDQSKKIKDLSSDELSKIASKIEEMPVEGELARIVKANIARLRSIGTYRGIRHSRSLPVRGQRTRRNARTKRGKRKTVGAFKKEALSKVATSENK